MIRLSSRSISLLVIAAFVVGCTSAAPVTAVRPEIRIEQMPRSEFDVEHQGATSIAYQMTVRNPFNEPITLQRVTMQAVGRSPYLLRDTPATLDQTIEPGGEATVTFSMWAYPREGQSSSGNTVWVQGDATFLTSTGTVTEKFSDSFHQPD